MAVDRGLWQHLNLLRSSPTFILREKADGGFAVSNPDQVTPDLGVVWLSADTAFANGVTLASVVVINTAAGPTEQALYCWLNDTWFEPAAPEDRAAILAHLAFTEADLFPYRWTAHLPLAL